MTVQVHIIVSGGMKLADNRGSFNFFALEHVSFNSLCIVVVSDPKKRSGERRHKNRNSKPPSQNSNTQGSRRQVNEILIDPGMQPELAVVGKVESREESNLVELTGGFEEEKSLELREVSLSFMND